MTQPLRSLFLIWAGIIFGVSLLATPAKFLAPDLSLAEALQVGRVTFRVMAVAEVVLLALACVLVLLKPPVLRRSFLWPLVIAVVLLLQYAVLLPFLNIQTDQVMAGEAPGQTSSLHSVYVAVELLKIGLLLFLGLRQRESREI
jgi:ABC-type uncharacterized transport system permease subunit